MRKESIKLLPTLFWFITIQYGIMYWIFEKIGKDKYSDFCFHLTTFLMFVFSASIFGTVVAVCLFVAYLCVLFMLVNFIVTDDFVSLCSFKKICKCWIKKKFRKTQIELKIDEHGYIFTYHLNNKNELCIRELNIRKNRKRMF